MGGLWNFEVSRSYFGRVEVVRFSIEEIRVAVKVVQNWFIESPNPMEGSRLG